VQGPEFKQQYHKNKKGGREEGRKKKVGLDIYCSFEV
jgi:hypothetical protein